MCFLEYGRPRSFHTLPKLIWCSSWGCNLGQSLSNHGPHVFCREKIRRESRPGKQFNLVIDEEPLDNACHVWLCVMLKYGCGQALKVRKDNWLKHLGDVALDVKITGNAYKRSARVISNITPYHNTRYRTSVVVHNAAVQHPLSTMSPDSNPTIVLLQKDA
ncbi:UNVERIFIED_CONTAM: hypothetical protein NCL1_31251 [Trichonephila clavipes]